MNRNPFLTQQQDGSVKAVFSGPKAPLTCIALGGPNGKTLFAGCWDKMVYSWEVGAEDKGAPYRYSGHSDFVKAVVCTWIGDRSILISGGADRRILVWDIETSKLLHSLQDTSQNMLAVQSLAIDPFESDKHEVLLFSASSDPHIRRWKIRLDGWEKVVESRVDAAGKDQYTILEHETTVYKLVFNDDDCETDLYTASADGTAKCLSRLPNFAAQDTYKHGDHVRAIAVTDQWLITAGRDENLKIWDRFYRNLYTTLEGHFDEITDLVLLEDGRLCSVSLDGTIRTWSLEKRLIDAVRKEQEDAADGKVDEEVPTTAPGVMTEDEEAELAALMDDV